MTGTPEDWRVGVRKGDVLSVSATYDTGRSSWYESMGIMPVAFDAGGSGSDPFATDVNVPGEVTHGHLAEGATGIAYPLADGPVRFDSGNLGFGPAGRTAAAQRIRWRTPRTIRPGTYTYFCRVHPFMRGAFRVER